MSELTRTQWRALLTRCPEQTYGDLISAVDDADTIDPDDPASVVDAAIANGPLLEDDAGMFTRIHLDGEPPESANTGERTPEDTDSEGTNPGSEAGDSDEDDPDSACPIPASVVSWSEVDFSTIEPRTWAPAQIEYESWMCRTDSKAPYSPWTDSDAPVECGRDHEDREGTVRCSTCDHAAGYKWGSDGSRKYVHADHATAREWGDMTPSLSSDLAFIQRDDDPFAFVDGDDVRDPETGEIHPAFRAILEHLGLTYADVSTSGSGVHAVYHGEIPLDGVPQAMFAIDDEPFGANEDVPEVEIYDSKHVCIATGDHVAGSGTEVNSWDEDTLTTILRANGIESSPDPSADASVDLTDHTPTATTSDETTNEIRDIFAAIDRLDARRVANDTIVATWNESAGTSAGTRAFAPTWGPNANGTANIVDEEIWQDTGGNGYGGVDVMGAIDCPDLPSFDERTQPRDLNGADWFRALEHLRELGYAIPELESSESGEEYRDDPTELAATVDPRRAWDAAGRVSPGDLTDDHDLPTSADGEAFVCPTCGEPIDVVRAVAIDEGLISDCSGILEDAYPSAYRRSRDAYDAPLPEYYTTTDAIAEFDAVLDVISEVTYWDLDTNALNSDITGSDDDVSGEAVRTLNPSWRESESEASVLVFPNGTIWDADTERVLDAIRFVAIDSGLIEDPTTPVKGALFTEAYRRCRDHYDAPLPRWEPAVDGERTVTPHLPDASELVDTRDVNGIDTDALVDARERVGSVFQDAATIDTDDPDSDPTPSVLTSLPATGKTTAAIKSARERPTAYLGPRKELQQQAVDKADRWGVDSYILPVFSEESVRSGILEEAVAHVRECGKNRLRDRWALVNAAVGAVEGEDNIDASDIFEEDSEEGESADLDRATCPVADGHYGVAWALAVHIASRLRLHPGEIHMRAQGLFGTSLPCCEDGSCEYGKAWEDVRDPDNCPDLLVGSYTQAHVESARTYYERDSSGGIDRSPRAVVLDEFPGEAFTNDLGPEAFDFATWLARSLRGDIDDRRDMFDADLYSDDWVRTWLKGAIGEDPDSDSDDPIVAEVERVIHALSRVGELLDARDSAAEVLSEYRGAVEELGVGGILTEFVEGTTPEDEVYRALEDLTEESIDPDLQGISEWIHRDVHEPLARATDSGTEPADAGIQTADTDLPIGGDLASLLEGAVDAAHTRGDAARERIRAAIESLRGGPDGCRQLAAWADDGYAHPDAHHILTGIITPTDDDSNGDAVEATRINTSSWAFDPSADEGSVMDVVSTAGNATTIVDRNDHGARLHTPPSRVAGNGEKAPLVGLDATGRAELWRVVLGEEVQTTDIFDSDRERRRFLEDALDLRVIQAADRPRYYEGDPATKDTDGDAALLEAIADEYAGIQAPRQRGEEPERVGNPAAITTKDVMNVLKSDPRLDDVVDTWDNYGNVTGKNELGDHRLAAILGCQHYGDDAIEQFAALAGEEVDTDRTVGRGPDLGYDSVVADAYLDHMTADQTMQAILRFARGEDGGATVVARTSALRADLPVVGRGEVVETWSDTATNIVEKARSLGQRFTSDDVHSAVDVSERQVRRVLSELVESGYLEREDGGPGRAHSYERIDDPGAGEVSIPDRDEAVPDTETPGRSSSNTYYTRNVRVFSPDRPREDDSTPPPGTYTRAPPAPGTIEGVGPPG